MKKLVILGAGQYGSVAKEVALASGAFEFIGFLDDHSEGTIGRLDDVASIACDAVFVAIGNPLVREKYLQKIRESGREIATLLHPLAFAAPSAAIGEGSILEAGAIVCSHAVVGTACILMANAVVGHNAVVGDYCQLKYGCAVGERAVVPAHSLIRPNSVWEE